MDGPISREGELWVPIKEFDGYLISNFGRVYYTEWDSWYAQWETGLKHRNGYLILEEDSCGYLSCTIKGKLVRVHRFVAEYFVEGYFVGCLVWFADNDKHNIRSDNLVIRRNNNASRRIVDLNTGKEYDSIQVAAKKLKLDRSNISKCCSGKVKSCGGHSFAYICAEELENRVKDRKFVVYKRLRRFNGREYSEDDLKWEAEEFDKRLYFDNQCECSRVLGIPQSNISRALKTGNDCQGWHFEWVE